MPVRRQAGPRRASRSRSAAGELDAAAVAGVLTRVLPDLGRAAAAHRTAQLGRHSGPGCPLLPPSPPGGRRGTAAAARTTARRSPGRRAAGGGVGCHGIIYFEARHAGDEEPAADADGRRGRARGSGLAPFVAEPHLIQNLGDGTAQPLRDAWRSGRAWRRASTITFKILYNAAVAMTGGQDVTGLMDVPALTRALEAEGVTRIVVCAEDPSTTAAAPGGRPASRCSAATGSATSQEELRGVARRHGDHLRPALRRARPAGCASAASSPSRRAGWSSTRRSARAAATAASRATACRCCPSTPSSASKRQIHDPSCNRDYTCLDGDCPSFVTITPRRAGAAGSRQRRPSTRTRPRRRPAARPAARPARPPPPVDGRYGIYFTGIGGTGRGHREPDPRRRGARRPASPSAGWTRPGLSQKAGRGRVAPAPGPRPPTRLGAAGGQRRRGRPLPVRRHPAGRRRQAPGQGPAPGRHRVVDRRAHPDRRHAAERRCAAPTSRPSTAPSPNESRRRPRGLRSTPSGSPSAVFGDHLLANVILLGAAFQLGGLPVTRRARRGGHERQGKAAAANREAFAWGRWAVHDPAAVEAALLAPRAPRGQPSAFDPSPRR